MRNFLLCLVPVSYTHLDVYKRQALPTSIIGNMIAPGILVILFYRKTLAPAGIY